MTGRAIEFMDEAGDQLWLCHLSFIKPHWPYIVPEPYASMYGPEHLLPPVRSNSERQNAHPVFRAYQESRICRAFARDDVRNAVLPAYMGLIKQIDDQMGRLFSWMEKRGLMENTMIVFTSDHGDYLGDHWMGEKDLFHDQSVRIPLIVYDPRPQADATRGTVSEALVEGIDLAPTFVDLFEGEPLPNILEGRDLIPLLWADETKWRNYAFSEYDYSTREARQILDLAQENARLIMCCSEHWKYIHCEGFRPMLFDLKNDSEEFVDLGESDEHEDIRNEHYEAINAWSRQHHTRITVRPERIGPMTGKEPPGVLIGFWDEAEFEAEFGKPFEERP